MSEGEIIPVTTHGIQTAGYYSDGQTFHPFIMCLCGFQTQGSDSWEDAGSQLDEHLEQFTIVDFKVRKR